MEERDRSASLHLEKEPQQLGEVSGLERGCRGITNARGGTGEETRYLTLGFEGRG